ncbi:hypothetical protein V1517DRAFT_92696 [Lipomyces orientalis]|uniref:Uncharacterized protein n=1 Tax=Lipomyces orientalis TaxID=1233043 RepID=A0ACC3TCC7_9ASCO
MVDSQSPEGNETPVDQQPSSSVVEQCRPIDTSNDLARPYGSTMTISEHGANGDEERQQRIRSSALLWWRKKEQRRPVGPLPQGQKNALLNDIEDNLKSNRYMVLQYSSWIAVLLQASLSAVATALAGKNTDNSAVVTLTASATVAGAVVALFKNTGEPNLSLQRKLELDHLKLRVEALNTNIPLNDTAALARVLSTLSCLREEYEKIDRQTSSAYIGVTKFSQLSTAANRDVDPHLRQKGAPSLTGNA